MYCYKHYYRYRCFYQDSQRVSALYYLQTTSDLRNVSFKENMIKITKIIKIGTIQIYS